MSVTEMWGRVQGMDVLPLIHDSDDWFFPLPEGMSGTLVCEFWVQDEAGNVGYRSAMIALSKGAIKCWRWLDSGCTCTLLATVRPVVSASIDRPDASMRIRKADAVDVTVRPICELRPHVCPMAGEV